MSRGYRPQRKVRWTGLPLLALASGAGVAGYLIGVLARAVFGVSA